MRIVVDLQGCQNDGRLRGIGRYSLSLLKEMLTVGRQHDYVIILNDRFPGTVNTIRRKLDGLVDQDAIRLCSFTERAAAADPANAWRNRAAQIMRHCFIEQLEPDILFIPSLFEGLWDASVVSIEPASFPSAFTLHDLIPLEDLSYYLSQQHDRDAYFRMLRDAKRADLIFAISAHVAQEASQLVGVDPDHIVVALNGVDDRFRTVPGGKAERRRMLEGFGITRPFVFNASPLERRKNLEGLIAGFGSMSPDAREGHQLVIAGRMDAYARNYLSGLVAAEGLPADTLVLPGYVTDEQLVALNAECALFAFPALSEGFGLPPLEAMASGAPVIGSTATSLPEVIGRADLLADPRDPLSIAACMERILLDPALQDELRAYGPRRSHVFRWSETARTVIASLEQLRARHVPAPVDVQTTAGQARFAVVCQSMSEEQHVAGRVATLIAALCRDAQVTLICPATAVLDEWIAAQVERRDMGWLDWNAAGFTCILYVTTGFFRDDVERVARHFPGIVLLLESIEKPDWDRHLTLPLPHRIQRKLLEAGGWAALVDTISGRLSRAEVIELVGTDPEAGGSICLREGTPGLPRLPMVESTRAAARLRESLGISPHVPLIGVIVSDERAAVAFMAALRASAVVQNRGVFAICVAGDDSRPHPDAQNDFVRLSQSLYRLPRRLAEYYRGLISASDLLIVAEGVASSLQERITADCAAMGRVAVSNVVPGAGLAALLSEKIDAQPRDAIRPTIVSVSDVDPGVQAWLSRMRKAVAEFALRPPSLLKRVESRLPGSVRGVRPDSSDLSLLSVALTRNAAHEREAVVCVDLTIFAKPHVGRRLKPHMRRLLEALLRAGGTKVVPVFDDGKHFVIANRFVAGLIGIDDFFLDDECFVARPGDRIIGLDLFRSFADGPSAAIADAQDRGAVVGFCALHAAPPRAGQEDALARAILAWAVALRPDVRSYVFAPRAVPNDEASATVIALIRAAAVAQRPLHVLSVVPVPLAALSSDLAAEIETRDLPGSIVASLGSGVEKTQLPVSAPRIADASFTVMGHLLGSYSLAIINRSLAATLERAAPGRVRFLPFESEPIDHTEGVPSDEKPLMQLLCARKGPAGTTDIVISQHWPLMPPKGQARLALALFAWEETHVPDAIVEVLNDGFDAVIAPSLSVERALTISGVRIPVATIGQPADLTPFRALAAAHKPRVPIKHFLHVSSCFRRKGIDLLLEAWARAFTRADGVRLTIKTFPNPHNDVASQVETLRARWPDLAPIEIIDHDVEAAEMPRFYADADVMVLPSRGEGYNLPALEAMAAGLPLIVTGFGGHLDFCSAEDARLLSFTFARSASHVANGVSLWVEPDLDDLVEALREYADPRNADLVERRRLHAIDSARIESDREAWADRFMQVVGQLLENADPGMPRVGWVSTWGVRCGIAQYSEYLLDAMRPEFRRNLTILCDERTDSSVDASVQPVWDLGNNKVHAIVEAALAQKLDALVVQHQQGLISWMGLAAIARQATSSALPVIAVLHNVRNLLNLDEAEIGNVVQGLRRATQILVHNLEDLNLLYGLGLRDNLGLFPHGAFAPEHAPWPRPLGANDSPIIGCHGFFFRHKGIDRLIRAAAVLRRLWPRLRLRLVNARFSAEHDHYVAECQSLARELQMDDAIDWHFDFLPVEEIEALLGECDLIVLPYAESEDSASGAIRTSLATMVPLVATRVKIFAELDGFIPLADDSEPDTLASLCSVLLASPQQRREIQAGMHAWLSAHDWKRVARTLEDMVTGIVRRHRLGWERRP